jgi:hypothetical protein
LNLEQPLGGKLQFDLPCLPTFDLLVRLPLAFRDPVRHLLVEQELDGLGFPVAGIAVEERGYGVVYDGKTAQFGLMQYAEGYSPCLLGLYGGFWETPEAM